jgi:DNA-binding FrmR family transcriptional regulator
MPEHEESAVLTDEDERRRILNRLRRLEGQIRGLQTMIESGKECDAVLTQVMAAKSALNQVGLHIVGHAMKNCLIDDDVATREELIDEAIRVFLKYSSCVK